MTTYAEALSALSELERARWDRYVTAHAAGTHGMTQDDVKKFTATTEAYNTKDPRIPPALHAVYRVWRAELAALEERGHVSPAHDDRIDGRNELLRYADRIELRWPGVGWVSEMAMSLRLAVEDLPDTRWAAIAHLNSVVVAEMSAERDHVAAVIAVAAAGLLDLPVKDSVSV